MTDCKQTDLSDAATAQDQNFKSNGHGEGQKDGIKRYLGDEIHKLCFEGCKFEAESNYQIVKTHIMSRNLKAEALYSVQFEPWINDVISTTWKV